MAQKQVRTPYTSMAGTPEREVEIFLVLAVFVCSPVHMGEARPIERLDRPRGRWQAGESEPVSGGGGGGKASMARLVTTPKTAQVVGAETQMRDRLRTLATSYIYLGNSAEDSTDA